MSIKKFEIEFQYCPLATVEIDEEKAVPVIMGMVEFWSDWENDLEDNDGDYTQTWLKSLARFIVNKGRAPSDDEGWAPLDGSCGIKLTYWSQWEPDWSEIEVKSIN